jgi:hypothetical protein
MMQRAEYKWINSPNGPNDNVNQLMALARNRLSALPPKAGILVITD